nr:MAG TPA: hypothetical protein [Caudoviricetes sp.]
MPSTLDVSFTCSVYALVRCSRESFISSFKSFKVSVSTPIFSWNIKLSCIL